MVLSEFCYHLGTSKNINIAQNLTPSYIFWEGIELTKTEHDVNCAPGNKNANNPDFFSYWTYWIVV